VLPWRGIFAALAAFGLVVTVLVATHLPETLHPEDRLAIAPARVFEAFRTSLSSRSALGYMFATMCIMGGLFGFINSAQQIFVDTFGAPRLFTAVFAGIAMFMAVASLLNSRVVGRLGTRTVSHGALIGYLAVAVIHGAVVWLGYESLVTFALLQAGTMFFFGLVASNFGALAMEPLGHVAGTASSVQGFVTTAGGALLGFLVGQHYDGTTAPLQVGLLGYGLCALGLVFFAEHGRLFRRTGARNAI
jgi:MFS transporter, DHA1 family, multidrug resistance protein